jgi:aromatic-L-amino-acid decarboxylase
LRAHIRATVAMAQEFAAWVADDPRFEIVAPHPFSLVCFRVRGTDEENEDLLRRLNRDGAVYLTHTKVDGRFVLRLAVGSPQTTREHVRDAWERICSIVDSS